MVVLLTVRESLVLEEVAIGEGHLALLAHEAAGVPLHVQRGDEVVGDGQVAAAALGGELVEVTGLAVGCVVLLVEPVVPKLLATGGAAEALGVEGLAESRDTLVQDWLLAVATPWTEETVIVLLAIRLAVPLKEVLGAQFHVAMGATEVLRVPRVTEGGDHLPDDWFVASKADAFLFCFYSLFVHVLLQVSKHIIKVRCPSDDGLVHVSLVHLEVVEGGHQIVQFGSGGGGAGCVGKHRGVGVSCGCGSCGGSHMDVLVNSVHMLMLSMVVLLPVLVLPDPEAHVLPLAVLQAIVGPVSVCPFCSVQLVMVDSVRAGELSRTHFRPQRRSWRTPDHVACGGESPALCHRLFCLHMTTVAGS